MRTRKARAFRSCTLPVITPRRLFSLGATRSTCRSTVRPATEGITRSTCPTRAAPSRRSCGRSSVNPLPLVRGQGFRPRLAGPEALLGPTRGAPRPTGLTDEHSVSRLPERRAPPNGDRSHRERNGGCRASPISDSSQTRPAPDCHQGQCRRVIVHLSHAVHQRRHAVRAPSCRCRHCRSRGPCRCRPDTDGRRSAARPGTDRPDDRTPARHGGGCRRRALDRPVRRSSGPGVIDGCTAPRCSEHQRRHRTWPGALGRADPAADLAHRRAAGPASSAAFCGDGRRSGVRRARRDRLRGHVSVAQECGRRGARTVREGSRRAGDDVRSSGAAEGGPADPCDGRS